MSTKRSYQEEPEKKVKVEERDAGLGIGEVMKKMRYGMQVSYMCDTAVASRHSSATNDRPFIVPSPLLSEVIVLTRGLGDHQLRIDDWQGVAIYQKQPTVSSGYSKWRRNPPTGGCGPKWQSRKPFPAQLTMSITKNTGTDRKIAEPPCVSGVQLL